MSIILNTFNNLIQSQGHYNEFRQYKELIQKIFEIFLKIGETSNEITDDLKSSILFAASTITYYEDSFKFFQSFLNPDEFFYKFLNIYESLNIDYDQESFMNIFTNLASIKEMHPFIIKYHKTLSIIKNIFISDEKHQRLFKLGINKFNYLLKYRIL